jgi:hypothetical protein
VNLACGVALGSIDQILIVSPCPGRICHRFVIAFGIPVMDQAQSPTAVLAFGAAIHLR